MRIAIWSDFACPYCYIGEKRLQNAARSLGLTDKIDIELKAFELDPNAPKTVQSDTVTRFASKYRLTPELARQQIDHISQLGREEGIDFRYATTRYTNTFDAHRLMKLAESKPDKGIAAKLNWLLFDAYFTKNLELSAPATLLETGKTAGLGEEEIRNLLNSLEFAEAVRADELEAAKRGVHGVPYFDFGNGVTIPGAISLADMRQVLTGLAASSGAEVHQCGPAGCVL